MDYSISNGIDFGEIFINEDETACAITIDPKKKKTTLLTIVRDLKFIFNVTGFSNLRKVYLKERIIKHTLPKDIDFVQLWFLGVTPEPEVQGKGTKLLNEIIEWYRDKKQALCLETSTQRNLSFYKKMVSKPIL